MVDLSSAIMRINRTISNILVWGLLRMLWNKVRRSRWILASIGSSPVRKYRLGIGELLLSFRNPLRILFWKIESDFMTAGRIGRAASPELRTGKE